jgi:nitroreductase
MRGKIRMMPSGAMERILEAAESPECPPMMDEAGAICPRSSASSGPSQKAIAVQGALQLGVRAPRATDAGTWGFVVVQGKERVSRYSDRAKTLLRSAIVGDSADRCVSDLLESESFNVFFDVGTLVAVCAPEGDRYAEADCWLAARNLELAAFARGLGACCTGFAVPLLRLPEVRAELGIPEGVTCFAALVVGAPRAMQSMVPRSRPAVLSWVR